MQFSAVVHSIKQTTLNRELFIHDLSDGVEIALLEDKKLVELHQDDEGQDFSVGDIVWAKIQKILPGLNAAFVDIGHQKNGFLHYTDLGAQIKSQVKFTKMAFDGVAANDLRDFKLEPETQKTGRIANVLTKKQPFLVQIIKEPISTKGHRLSSDISLPGRYLVLIPFNNSISISKKISSQDERKRLLKLIESIRPKNFGIIVRTVAEGKAVADLHDDLLQLSNRWKQITTELKGAAAPKKVLSEMNKTGTLLRDLLNASFNKIVVDSKPLLAEVRTYIARIAPDKEHIVQIHSDKTPMFDAFGITKQIKATFGKKVQLESGASLVIEHTEALHVIDVNSGHKMSNNENQDENAMKVNMEAAEEICRQLRLRDLGGIIVIDFIDMRNPEYKKQVNQLMTDKMKLDKARHTLLPISKFGVMQITRQRVKPQLSIITSEVCPTCNGTGQIGPSILIIDEIERNLSWLAEKQNQKQLTLYVHAYVEAYIKQGWFNSIKRKWKKQFRIAVKVFSTEGMGINEFHFYDKEGEEISLTD